MKRAFWSPRATLMTSMLMTRGYVLAASADRSMPLPRPNVSSANPALAPSELLLLLGLRLCGMRTAGSQRRPSRPSYHRPAGASLKLLRDSPPTTRPAALR